MASGSILNLKFLKISLICAFFLLAGVFSKSALAQEKASEPSKEKFDPKDVILEHISDSHFWPFTFPLVAEKQIPLPVILFSDKGLEVFSSGKLLPEGTVYAGPNYSYKLEHNKIKVVDASGIINEEAGKKVWDFSITRNTISMFMTFCFIVDLYSLVFHQRIKSAKVKRRKACSHFWSP